MTQQDAAADLAFIRGVLEQSRAYTAARGGYFVIWGVVIGIALFVTWLQVTGALSGNNFLVWTACVVFGWVGTAVLIWRERQHAVVPLMARNIGLNWMAVGIAMSVLFFVGVPAGTLSSASLAPLSALFVGVGMFNTGTLSGMHWLRGVAVGWWAGGIYMLLVPGPGVLLAMALLLVCFQILPGLLLIRAARADRG